MYIMLEVNVSIVIVNEVFNTGKPIGCGVPQGRCLGSFLYAIYTNNLPMILQKSKVAMYVDDSTVNAAGSKIDDLTRDFNKELQSVVKWVTNNKFVLNVTKILNV